MQAQLGLCGGGVARDVCRGYPLASNINKKIRSIQEIIFIL